ncbi:MAG: ABC transporter substrate-binding protein, partial [Marinobacter sp.]|nr:ABC transporter substrate-binding protein [Marinobacter sp.]
MAVTPKTLFRRTLALFAFVMSGSLLAADPVVVSSKIDTEGSVLGQMVLQSLEGAGIPVEN